MMLSDLLDWPYPCGNPKGGKEGSTEEFIGDLKACEDTEGEGYECCAKTGPAKDGDEMGGGCMEFSVTI